MQLDLESLFFSKFTFARMLRTPTPFALFEFCFFSSLKDNIHGHLPMTIFLADYIPWSITADAMKAYMYARNVHIACTLYCSRRSQLKKIFIGR
jgi:hypothetical protein